MEEEKSIFRYLLQEGDDDVIEYRHSRTGESVLPCLGAGDYLFPQMLGEGKQNFFSPNVRYLGNPYRLANREIRQNAELPKQYSRYSIYSQMY